MSTTFSIGQMNQLADAFQMAGWTPNDLTKLRNYHRLSDVQKLIQGKVQVAPILINLDADPSCSKGCTVEFHKKQGVWEWNPDKLALFFSDSQKKEKYPKGFEVWKDLENQPVFNINLLEYLLTHQYLIPDELRGKNPLFWGTVYKLSGIAGKDEFMVRSLHFGSSGWCSQGYLLHEGCCEPALIEKK